VLGANPHKLLIGRCVALLSGIRKVGVGVCCMSRWVVTGDVAIAWPDSCAGLQASATLLLHCFAVV
jgi:hypothetical protein